MSRLSNILTLSLSFFAMATAAMAQNAGDKEVTLILGNNTMFQGNSETYLLKPYHTASYGNSQGQLPSTGLGVAGDNTDKNQSADPSVYLNLSELGSNSLMNMVGVQGRYFILSNVDVNLTFGMNVSLTPQKDYVNFNEVQTPNPMQAPAHRYIQGRVKSSLMTSIGGDYHFKVGKSGRLNAYTGGQFGYQLARVQTNTPWNGQEDYVASGDIYREQSEAGQVWAIKASIVAGMAVETNLGLCFGLEVSPAAYQFSAYSIGPKGYEKFNVGHHNLTFLSNPQVKIGFRF